MKLCFVGGPRNGDVEDGIWKDPRIGDGHIAVLPRHVPAEQRVPGIPGRHVVGIAQPVYHRYRVSRFHGDFAMLDYDREVSAREVAEMMPRHFDWDPSRGLIAKVPLEDRPPQ